MSQYDDSGVKTYEAAGTIEKNRGPLAAAPR